MSEAQVQEYISGLSPFLQIVVMTGWFGFQVIAMFGILIGTAWVLRRLEK